MRVFVSSTCYDLVDLRAELFEDLRDLGLDPLFSDLKESEFETAGQPAINSIETCLENLRRSDVVVFILSQRYGPPLSAYGGISATHLEYKEARVAKKPILFYIRDHLVTDWSAWKRNNRSNVYTPAWAAKGEDAARLFDFIQEHAQLTGETNNWYWRFATSVDLRADLRKRLKRDAFLATGEKLIRAGQVPILVVVGQGLVPIPNKSYLRFRFDVVNAGTVAAINVQGHLSLPGGHQANGVDASCGAMLPGEGKRFAVSFDVPGHLVQGLFRDTSTADSEEVLCSLTLGYCTPSGHLMEDRLQFCMVNPNGEFHFAATPSYKGKRIAGMTEFVTPGPALRFSQD